jgi:hypothetical protein
MIRLALALALALLGSCSKHDAPPAGSAAPSSAGTSPSGTGGGCDKIPRADFQALLAVPVTEVSGAPVGACNAYFAKGQAGFSFAALIYADDAPRPFEPTAPGAHAVSGVGDQAYWRSTDADGPRLEAMKGKVRCEISPPHAPQSALKSMAEADQNAYAQLMGKLCSDMFAAQ